MKITENINLGGLIYTIDSDALQKLQNYLNSVEGYFEAKEEREEIVADIESRIAELLQSKLDQTKEVVTLADIDGIIEILGMPEDFLPPGLGKTKQAFSDRNYRYNRLYRDPDNSILGGVCSGLGYYFSADPVIIRVLFVLLTFFAAGGVILYIVLWAVLPPAKSMAEKIEMKRQKH